MEQNTTSQLINIKSSQASLRALTLPNSLNTYATGHYDEVARIVRDSGGIFYGPAEIGIPSRLWHECKPVPAVFSSSFLKSKHPLRDGCIAKHCILGLATDTKYHRSGYWYLLERDVIPGSLNINEHAQDAIINSAPSVQDCKLSTLDSMPGYAPNPIHDAKKIFDGVISFLLKSGVPLDQVPLRNYWGRTTNTNDYYTADKFRFRLTGYSTFGKATELGVAWGVCASRDYGEGDERYESYRQILATLSIPDALPRADVGLLAHWVDKNETWEAPEGGSW